MAILQGAQNIRENSLGLLCEKIGNVAVSFRIEKLYMNMMFQKDLLDKLLQDRLKGRKRTKHKGRQLGGH